MKICNKCKCPNDNDYMYCRKCGAELKDPQKPVWLLVVVAIVGAVALVAFFS